MSELACAGILIQKLIAVGFFKVEVIHAGIQREKDEFWAKLLEATEFDRQTALISDLTAHDRTGLINIC